MVRALGVSPTSCIIPYECHVSLGLPSEVELSLEAFSRLQKYLLVSFPEVVY
jgi:hypothetical protein